MEKYKVHLVQVPSNLVLLRLGGRCWLGSLVLAWGTVAACCALIRTRWQFFALRIALGCAEAGTMPGMWCAAYPMVLGYLGSGWIRDDTPWILGCAKAGTMPGVWCALHRRGSRSGVWPDPR